MLEAIILAGGFGTRLREIVPDVPKPIAPIKERPFLCYLIDYWIMQGVRHFILAVGYKYRYIQTMFGNYYAGAEITYSIETLPLGTGGALLSALDYLKTEGDFIMMNGDTYFKVDLKELTRSHHDNQADMTLCLKRVVENSRYGRVIIDRKNRIQGFNDTPPSTFLTDNLINAGVYFSTVTFMREQKQRFSAICSMEKDILPKLVASNTVLGTIFDSYFIDIGIPEDYFRAKNELI